MKKKKIFAAVSAIVLPMAALMALAACGRDNGGDTRPDNPPASDTIPSLDTIPAEDPLSFTGSQWYVHEETEESFGFRIIDDTWLTFTSDSTCNEHYKVTVTGTYNEEVEGDIPGIYSFDRETSILAIQRIENGFILRAFYNREDDSLIVYDDNGDPSNRIFHRIS
ncbi:MAG: hypothetical protein IJ739_02080 [Bacteroidaceae bacterium]|nr:hypothetical protein [Bacteroidaceae bacterium]